MAEIDSLPSGFVLDQPQNDLPQGFTPDNQQPKQDSIGSLLGITGLGALGLGYGIKKGINKYWTQPRVPYYKAESELVNMQRGLGLENTPLEFIPKALSGQYQSEETMGTRRIADIETEKQLKTLSLESAKKDVQASTNLLKNQLESFDKNVITKSTEDLSMAIKTQYPEFFRSAGDNYEKGIASIESHFENTGAKIDTLSFEKGFVDKALKQARQRGIMEENLSSLLSLKQQLTPKVGQGGFYAEEMPMSFSQAKGLVSQVVSQDPTGAVGRIARDVWGEHLENISSGSVKEELGNLNSQYRTFKQIQKQLSRLSNPNTGEFNIKGLNDLMLNYTKDRVNNGIIELMDYLSEGSDITKPVKGIKEKWGSFNKMLEERFKFESNIQKMQETEGVIEKQVGESKIGSLKARQIVEQEVRTKLDKINALQEKYKLLAAKYEQAGEKIPFRLSLKPILRMIGGKAGEVISGVSSVYPMISQAFEYQKDPAAFIASQGTGLPQEQLIQLKKTFRKMQEGQELTEQEKDEMISAGMIL